MRNHHILYLLLILFSCKNNDIENTAAHASTKEQQEMPDFFEFYDQFHTDSAFQLSHIIFPLPGAPSKIDSNKIGEQFYWSQNDWNIHKALSPDEKEFIQSFSSPNKRLVVDFIYTPGKEFIMERRFAKMGEEWKLIYFSDLQAVGF